jgi:hypothetical protein
MSGDEKPDQDDALTIDEAIAQLEKTDEGDEPSFLEPPQ